MASLVVTFSESEGFVRVMVGGSPVMADTADYARAVSVFRKAAMSNPLARLEYYHYDTNLTVPVTVDGEV